MVELANLPLIEVLFSGKLLGKFGDIQLQNLVFVYELDYLLSVVLLLEH